MSEHFQDQTRLLSIEEKEQLHDEATSFAHYWVSRGNASREDVKRTIDLVSTATRWLLDRDFHIGDQNDIAELVEKLHPTIREERRHLERKANTDPLTGLANKEQFNLARVSADTDEEVGFIFVDAVNFKKLNDTHGQEAGDAEIIAIANHVKAQADQYGYGGRTFRIGGDEFAVIAPNTVIDDLRQDIIEKYDQSKTNNITSLRVAKGTTYDETIQNMVELKKEEKSKGKLLGRIATQLRASF